ncbi:MAG: hypothetical protein KDI28_08420, partial [Pseudomonadales bacterium]|nr:hypothetical protein [Pseudomonadales bacterium]
MTKPVRAFARGFVVSGLLAALFSTGTSFAQVPGPVKVQGTGGSISTSGDYVIHTFTSSGTFTPPPGITSVEVLVIGGGGGGPRTAGGTGGGGGGAGGVISNSAVTISGATTVTVGAAGAGATSNSTNGGSGGNSVFAASSGTLTAVGGGGGGTGTSNGLSGGSGGGGGASNNTSRAGGSATSGQGFNGGTSFGTNTNNGRAGGGGGGAGAVGVNGANQSGGAGGAGFSSAITGSVVTYAGGGGGSNGVSGGAGGTGGGGAGSSGNGVGENATGYGSGGGAGRGNGNNGGNGSAGIVIVRYLAPVLTMVTQPSTTAANGVAFATQPQVRLTRSDGVTGINGVSITASLSFGSPTLGGTLNATTAGDGTATFSNLSLSGTEGIRRLAFNAGGFTGQVVSNNVTLQSSLTMQTQPSATVVRGASLATAPVVRALTNAGSPTSGLTVTVSLNSGAGTLGGTTSVSTNGSGNATFTGLSISGANGAHTLLFTAPSWNSVVSATINVTSPTLSITQQPSSTATQGALFAQQPIVRALDGGGNPISGVDVTAAIASGAGSISGTVTRTTDASGYATFTDLLIGGSTGAHTLNFSASNWNPVVSNTITVTAPTKFLTMSTQPSTTVALGEVFPQQPVILATDGSPVSGVTVTAALDSGSGTVGGTLTAVTNASGLATFSNLYITGVSGNHTLRFTSPTWTQAISNTIAVQPSSLTITQQAEGTVENGAVFSPQPVVRALDSVGNPISGLDVTVNIQTGGGTLGGTLTITTDGSGLASFTNLAISGAPGDRTLRFSTTGWNSVDSNPISITASPLEVSQQASTPEESGVIFSQQPVVVALDGSNNPVSGVSVTAVIQSGGGTLGGTATVVTDVNGEATFTDLSITGAPGDRVLRFSASNWLDVDSDAITIFSYLTISQQPSTLSESGATFAQQPIIQALDGNSSPVSGVDVSVSIDTGTGSLTGTTTVSTNGSGLANFTDLAVVGPPGAVTLSFSATGWGSVVSDPVDITAPPGNCNFEGGVIGSQLVELMACTYTQLSPAATNVTVEVPPGTVEGDLLVTAISTSGNSSVTGPGGWTEITDLATGGGGGQTLSIYTRTATASEPANYTFVQAASDVAYAYMMRFDGASGVVLEATESTGNGGTATAPALTTTLRDTLIVRMIANRNGLTPNPAPGGIIAGHRNITQDSAGNADGAGAYVNQPTPGSSGTADFSISSGRWVTQTIGIEPSPVYHFEITHAATYGVCAANSPVTVTVRNSYGELVTDYAGTMTLTSSGGVGNYTLSGGTPANFDNLTANDGIAQYTFSATDSGQVILNFASTALGTITFNATATDVETENYSSSMTLTTCAFRIIHDGNGSVCSQDPITIRVVDSLGNLVTNYAGNINISTVGTTGGNWSKTGTPSDAQGTLDNGAANDGAAAYAFVAGDGGEIVLNFQDLSVETVNFNITAAGVSQPAGPYDPNFTTQACSFRITHSSAMDVCSPEQITITIVDNTGATVTGYTGTIN